MIYSEEPINELAMLRKITTAILMLHISFLMLVVAFNSHFDVTSKGMGIVYLMAAFVLILLINMKYNKTNLLAIIGCTAYFVLNIIALTSLLIFTEEPDFTKDALPLLSFFMPGILCSIMLAIVLLITKSKHLDSKAVI